MDENYSNPLVASPSIVYPPSPSAPSLARRSPRDFETPTATRARGAPPRRRTPQVTARVFARPVRLRRRCGRLKHRRSSRSADDSLRASRLPRLPRLARARARGDETIAERWSGLSRDDGLAPPPRALATVDDGERERSPVSNLARLARSLARHNRARPRRASHCRRRGGWLSCRGTEGDTLTSHRPS